MDAQVQALTERVPRQDERISQLERRLARNSRNSSLPPSQDPPGKSPPRGKGRSGREQGGQPGHEGHGRDLLPTWAADEVIPHWPDRCGCAHVFLAAELVPVGEPVRHQVEELPEIATNHAERALRSAVIYRKLSLGSQSTAGEQRSARLLSAHHLPTPTPIAARLPHRTARHARPRRPHTPADLAAAPRHPRTERLLGGASLQDLRRSGRSRTRTWDLFLIREAL
jgi:hypothetical protein